MLIGPPDPQTPPPPLPPSPTPLSVHRDEPQQKGLPPHLTGTSKRVPGRKMTIRTSKGAPRVALWGLWRACDHMDKSRWVGGSGRGWESGLVKSKLYFSLFVQQDSCDVKIHWLQPPYKCWMLQHVGCNQWLRVLRSAFCMQIVIMLYWYGMTFVI